MSVCVVAEAPVADPGAATPQPTCLRCGAILRRGNRGPLCHSCERGTLVPADWNPRHDPHFAAAWLTDLVMHAGEWRHPSDVWPSRDERQRLVIRQLALEVAIAAERFGLLIERDRMLGYRVVGHGSPPKYVHLRGKEAAGGELPGQLTFGEGEAVG